MAVLDKRVPGPRTNTGQCQAFLAAEPCQSGAELAFTARCGLPAAEFMKVFGSRNDHVSSFSGTGHHAIESWNRQSGQAHGDLIARPDIQCLPALQRARADAADGTVVEAYRGQLQHRRNPATAADLEVDLAHLGQRLGVGMFPGGDPVRRTGLPALRGWALALTHDHAIRGERQGIAIPMLAPACGLGVVFQWMRIGRAVLKTHGLQASETLRHSGRPVRPVPDKQPDGVGLLRADCLPRQ